MSKLIVEMEMPSSCFDCPCHNGESGYCQADKQHRYIYNDIPTWCPIKGVLHEEHGDLIDRDEMFAAINSRVVLIDSCTEGKPSMKELFERSVLCTCLHDVVCAKAVIAAERKDDGK